MNFFPIDDETNLQRLHTAVVILSLVKPLFYALKTTPNALYFKGIS